MKNMKKSEKHGEHIKHMKNEKIIFCSDGPGEFKFKFSSIFWLLFIKLSFPGRYDLPDKNSESAQKTGYKNRI